MNANDLRVIEPFDFHWRVPARGFEWIQAYVPPNKPWEETWHDELQWLLIHKDAGGSGEAAVSAAQRFQVSRTVPAVPR